MYGTIFRMRVKPGQEEAVRQEMGRWDRERAPKAKGAVATYLFKPDGSSNLLIGVAVFQDRETYRANADDPEQHQWFLRLRACLEEDPAWEDGEVLES